MEERKKKKEQEETEEGEGYSTFHLNWLKPRSATGRQSWSPHRAANELATPLQGAQPPILQTKHKHLYTAYLVSLFSR